MSFDYQYQITIGDWSGDGHDRTEDITFNCNYPKQDIFAAYLKACEKTKVYLHKYGERVEGGKVYCEKFENDCLPASAKAELEAIGIDFENVDQNEFYDNRDHGGDIRMTPPGMFDLLMEMAKTNLPDLEWKVVDPEEFYNPYEFGSIGYGVFSI